VIDTVDGEAVTAPGSQIVVSPTREALMEQAAERFAAAVRDAIAARGRFVVALSGGATPRRLYSLLAAEPQASKVEWPEVHVFWGDERAVPPDDAASNYRMAREALLERVAIQPQRIHRIHGEDEPAAAAAAYERLLRETFATPAGPPRCDAGARFDLVLLGLGEDGHVASLFPGSPAIHERVRWAVAEAAPPVPPPRVTLTPPVLNAAAEIVFLISGRDKAPALRQVLHAPFQPELRPAQVVEPRCGHLVWLLDAAAAADLEGEGRSRS
jgi:6-phosphogluconolactonase